MAIFKVITNEKSSKKKTAILERNCNTQNFDMVPMFFCFHGNNLISCHQFLADRWYVNCASFIQRRDSTIELDVFHLFLKFEVQKTFSNFRIVLGLPSLKYHIPRNWASEMFIITEIHHLEVFYETKYKYFTYMKFVRF